MTAIQLNAELYRAIDKISDDETLMERVLNFIKALTSARGLARAEASAQANHLADEDNRLLDKALAKFHKDWGGGKDAAEIAEELRGGRYDSRTIETW